MTWAIKETNYHFPQQQGFYRGKVRDVYLFSEMMVIVVSDRISAFDVVLPRPIPHKGQVLNQIAATFLEATKDSVPNWFIKSPHPRVTIGRRCRPIPVEMVIRGYLSGHAWRCYQEGKRSICGVPLPNGLKENDRLPQPIITPTTKASSGHDEDISKEEILKNNLVSESDYTIMEQFTHELFSRGTAIAAVKGLILVDTKYEFGVNKDQVMLIDEIHTPDSSRYFYTKGYEDRQKKGEPQKQLSKEFVREWLMEHNFQGKQHQTVPEMTDAVVNSISERYIELYETVIGERFIKPKNPHKLEEIEQCILESLPDTIVS